ncbi:MAG: Hint domain-containing protein, partial [Neisseria sp.]
VFGFGFKTKGYKHDTIKQWLNDLYKESSILKTSPNGMLLKIGRKFQYDKHREAFEEIFVKPIVKGEWNEIRHVMEKIETHTGRIVSEDEQLQAIKEMFESERYLLISEETDKLLYDLHQKISDTRPSEKEMAQHACFIAGTLVHTDKGLVPINKIKVGDRVLSRDENNPDAENVYKRVVSTFKSVEKKRIIHQKYLTQKGYGYLFCTEDHPIWADHFMDVVEDENGKLIPERTHDGWTPAIYLSSYDKHALRTVDNGFATVESFETTSKATSILGKNYIGLWDNGYGEYEDRFITVTEDDYTI